MKFVILALLALASGLHAKELNLKDLGFVLFGKHGDGTKVTPAAGSCPLGVLPDTVFLHKTFKKGDHFFTWVRPVHGKVHKLVCGSVAVWEAAAGEVLLDLHFVGNKDSEKFLHLELFHPAVGSHHVFLKFAGGATPGAGVVLGMAAFVVGVHGLVKDLPKLEGLPAHAFVHALAAHAAHLAHHGAHAALKADGGLVLIFLLLFVFIGTATNWLLVLVVELTDKTLSHSLIISSKPSKNYNSKNSLKGMDNQAELNPVELMNVIEELRKEIQKLKEVSYKNSLAINGLSKSEYKLQGVGENLESAKHSKFGKGSAVVNLNSNGNRQDMKFAKIRDEDSEFVPGIIEYKVNISQQS
ncbi:uncharacterized protein TA05025 [Theileria annulata]|uniref:Uncharacterized protein n=1 Tax=Theileria annulata TaxID=5874 RepID=Q4UBQ9_THEAN|nr:uncharacterized protein TA05025 [Theileria annulata]CAI75742.1 hypothetical protein TA05025 [Theileria annulata]|eukprot:XP_955218.1 hypothetical protein TA05025 [Theileria annulata]